MGFLYIGQIAVALQQYKKSVVDVRPERHLGGTCVLGEILPDVEMIQLLSGSMASKVM